MRHYTCKCGAIESMCSGMMPNPCFGCSKCGTNTLKEPTPPHDFKQTEVETDDGDATLSRCKWCYQTKAQIEKAAALEAKAK